MSVTAVAVRSMAPNLDSSPLPSMARTSTSSPLTPSRGATRFRSVKDMLSAEDILSLTPSFRNDLSKDAASLTASAKLKRPNKSTLLARKSTNFSSPSLALKNGKITGKLSKPSSTVLTKKTKTIESFDVFDIPSSSPPEPETEEQDKLLETPPRETKTSFDSYVPAKRIWTPVKENSQLDLVDLCTPDDFVKTTSTASFTSLLSSYRHDDTTDVSVPVPSLNEPLTKRRCLGFVNVPGRKSSLPTLEPAKTEESIEVSKKPAAKPKKPKAKPKTITGLAVAPYCPAEVEPLGPAVIAEPVPEKSAEDVKTTKLRKKRQSTITARNPSKRSPKKADLPLLSPKSVRKQMDTQTFIFCTASQELSNDTPEEGWPLETTGRCLGTIQTHAKMHAKASYDIFGLSDSEESTVEEEKPEPKSVQTECRVDTSGWGVSELDITKGLRAPKSDMGMWSMGARDLVGKLQSVEVMDLMDEDDFDPSQKLLTQLPGPEVEKMDEENQQVISTKATKESDLPTVRWTQLPTPTSTNPASVEKEIKSKSKTTEDENINPNLKSSATTSKFGDRPNFEGYTMVQLQTQIQKYGFKPIKSRKTMIDTLNRCWDSAEIIASSQAQPVVDVREFAMKPKGKKKAAAVEAGDSEPKKRGRKPKAVSEPAEDQIEPPPLKRSRKSSDRQGVNTSALFKHIATAIKLQTSSPGNPSWRDQILMDETIILDEFTEWLVNIGLKESVWEDCGVCEDTTEARVEAVKLWCEARSVSFERRV